MESALVGVYEVGMFEAGVYQAGEYEAGVYEVGVYEAEVYKVKGVWSRGTPWAPHTRRAVSLLECFRVGFQKA